VTICRCDAARAQDEDYCLKLNVEGWLTLAEHAALGDRTPILEDGPEIPDEEQLEGDRRDRLEGVYRPGCDSLDRAGLTEGKAEELRRRTMSSSSDGQGPTGATVRRTRRGRSRTAIR
jgi:hypothetical protein